MRKMGINPLVWQQWLNCLAFCARGGAFKNIRELAGTEGFEMGAFLCSNVNQTAFPSVTNQFNSFLFIILSRFLSCLYTSFIAKNIFTILACFMRHWYKGEYLLQWIRWKKHYVMKILRRINNFTNSLNQRFYDEVSVIFLTTQTSHLRIQAR